MLFAPARDLILAATFALAAAAAPVFAQDQAPADGDTVVATVNGAPITLGDMVALRGDLPEQYQQLPDQPLYDGIRQQLVDQTLIAAAAEAAGIDDEKAVSRAIALQRQGLLAQFYMQRQVEERVTDARIEEAYAQRIAQAAPIEEVRASHILVADEQKAKDLLAQIEGGADFAALAAEHGSDGTRAQGGDLGYFSREMMVAPFADAAFAMEVGAVGGPVQTQFGWHLIKLTDRREQPKPTLEEVRAELEQAVSSEVIGEIMTELRAAAALNLPEDRPGLDRLRDDSVAE